MEDVTKVRRPECDTDVQLSIKAGLSSDSLESGNAQCSESNAPRSTFTTGCDGDDRFKPADSRKTGEDDIGWLVGDHLIIFFTVMAVILFALVLFSGSASDVEL